MAALRAEVRKNVEREVKRRLAARVPRKAVMQALVAVNAAGTAEVHLLARKSVALIENARQEMQQRGFDPKEMPFPAEICSRNKPSSRVSPRPDPG